MEEQRPGPADFRLIETLRVGRRLRDFSLRDDLPEVGRQAVVVAGQHLIKGLLAFVGCLPGLLFAPGRPALVLLYLGLKISHHHGHYSPATRTTPEGSPAKVEKMSTVGRFRSVAVSKPWHGAGGLPHRHRRRRTKAWP